MLKIYSWRRAAPAAMLVALLIALAPILPASAARHQPGCAVARHDSAGTARWLAGCGKSDLTSGPEAVARAALSARAGALGLRADGRDLRLGGVVSTPAATHVRFDQVYQGVPVFGAQLLVQYGAAGEIQLINNHALPNLQIDVAPAIDATVATSAARMDLTGSPGGGELRQAELVIDGQNGAPELAWHVVVFTAAPLGEWNVMVSARTGKLLRRWNAIANDSGSGMIYRPNPVQSSGDTALRDNANAAGATLNGDRTAVTLNHLDSTTNKLKGSFVDLTATGIDQSGQVCSLPYIPGQANESTRNYNYTRDDDRFEEVNAYAAIDGVQSWIQDLGFRTILNRPIAVDVHCTSADNSFFSPGDQGLHFGDGGVDDAEDSDIVIHEYGHAIQTAQVPGWGPGGNTEQRAMGEGFGDFLAGMYHLDQGSAGYLSARKYCIGAWDATEYNPATQNNPGSGCLRWINGRDESNGADIGRYSGSPTEVHNDGRFWSAALTCVYEGLGASSAARDKAVRLVLEHQFSLTPDQSDQAFEEATDALVLADQNLYGGADRALIKNCAYARGLIPLPVPALTTPAQAAVIPAGSITTIGWALADPPTGTTYRLEYSDDCAAAGSFGDTVEAGAGGWTVAHSGGSLDWQIAATSAHSPSHSWFVGDESFKNDQYLVSPPLPINGSSILSFWHRYNLESSFDGGVVEASENNGSSWSDLSAKFILNGYNASIAGTSNSALAGRGAFTGLRDWTESRLDLSSYSGKTIRLRFREADDDSAIAANQPGWWVDDITITPAPTWKLLATTAAGATSYSWHTPAMPGTYCLRVRGLAPNSLDTAYSATRLVTLGGANSAPTIGAIADRSVVAGAAPAPIGFTIGDAETASADLAVMASSSNQTLVPDANIVLGGSGANRTVAITPAGGRTGSATITIAVSDGAMSSTRSFVLTVQAGRRTFLPLMRR